MLGRVIAARRASGAPTGSKASIQSRVQHPLFCVAMPALSSEKEKPNNKKGYF